MDGQCHRPYSAPSFVPKWTLHLGVAAHDSLCPDWSLSTQCPRFGENPTAECSDVLHLSPPHCHTTKTRMRWSPSTGDGGAGGQATGWRIGVTHLRNHQWCGRCTSWISGISLYKGGTYKMTYSITRRTWELRLSGTNEQSMGKKVAYSGFLH